MNTLFTIGYVSFTPDSFVETLKRHCIQVVADVRSSPYSRFKPEFNREAVQRACAQGGLRYVFLGEACGARIEAPECYADGRVDFQRVAAHPKFLDGIARLRKGAEQYRVAVLCAEADPIICHRTVLISRVLAKDGLTVEHILKDGSLESHEQAEQRLMEAHDLGQPQLFMTRGERLAEAYVRQGRRIAYTAEDRDEQAAAGPDTAPPDEDDPE